MRLFFETDIGGIMQDTGLIFFMMKNVRGCCRRGEYSLKDRPVRSFIQPLINWY